MEMIKQELRGFHPPKPGIPWGHVIGFVISLVLTIIPLWLTLARAMRPGRLFAVIMTMAVLQVFVQLFFFMHVRESHGPAWHIVSLLVGMIITVTVVAGSIWVMSFGWEAY